MDIFLEILKAIFLGLLATVVAVIMVCWLFTSIDILHYTEQNNVLLKALCVENGLNVDSLMSTTQNDTLNLKTDLNRE